jgi:hypothetical protein
VGDVALLDAARPAACFADDSQWLRLQLPRQLLISHLGFEPQGGLHARAATPAARLLYDLVRDACNADVSASSAADSYMQLAVYDLLGALFAPCNPPPISRHADKLFARIRGVIKDGFADPDFSPRGSHDHPHQPDVGVWLQPRCPDARYTRTSAASSRGCGHGRFKRPRGDKFAAAGAAARSCPIAHSRATIARCSGRRPPRR